jgi:hypothetical protein
MLCSFVDTLRAVIIDVRWFLMLLLITLFGFAGASAEPSTLPWKIAHHTEWIPAQMQLPHPSCHSCTDSMLPSAAAAAHGVHR